MQARLKSFFEELWKSLWWVESLFDKAEIVGKAIGVLTLLLPFLGITGGLISALTSTWQPWLAIYLVGIPLLYLTWLMAVAWERTKGPIIQIGEFSYDQSWKIFDLKIKNGGAEEVFAKVYAVEILDSKGQRIPRIDSQIPLHWRGERYEKFKLFGDRHGICGALQLEISEESMSSKLHLAMPGGDDFDAIQTTHLLHPGDPIPLDKQDSFTLTIRVDFLDMDDRFVKSKLKSFRFIPDKSCAWFYRITSK
jgi:hypothetical protein